MMRKLLEAMTKFAGEPEQKPGEQWKGTDKGTPGNKLVGSADESVLKDLSKGVTPKTKEEELAEAFANFNEDDLGVEEKRPGRKSDRPSREYTKNGKPSKRYTPVKEGWMNGSDRVNLPDGPMTYWNGTGRLQNEYNELYEKLVPSQGAAETIEGEVLRASSKIVYRHFNDGDLFNQASFDQLKQYIGTVTDYDDLAEKAIEFALKAQGNYHPNTGWDSLDAMDYGPTDDDNGWDEEDEYDDEDDTNWDEEDDELGESSDVVARYADDRARGTGFVYNVDATGQITSSGNIRHNKKFSSPEKAMAYLDKCGFTKKGELEEGMEEFAKSQAKKRAEKRKSIPWPKEVPTDAEQERNRTRDEEENDPHPYTQVGEGEHDAEFIDHEDNWYNMADWARAEFKKGKSVEEVIKYLRDNDYLGPRDINNFMKTVSGEKWNESVEEGKHFRTAYGWAGGRNEKTGKMYKHPDQIKADREAKKAVAKDAMNNMFGGDAEDLTQNLKIREAGMPSSVIKHKQALASKTPEALYAGFKQVADKQGKSVESLARSAAWRHGYGKGNGQGSAHYWDKIKHLSETVSEADMFKAGQRAIKNIKSTTQQRKSEAEKMAIAQAQIDADRENERDRFSQEELYPSDDSHDVDEGWEADLARSNRERMKKERAAAKPMAPIAKAKPNYDRVFQDINSAIGDTFPDGDPMDALMRKYRDSYGDLNIDLLNKACRVNGAKSYHDYVAKVWQQHMQDNPDLVQGGNPWVAENDHPQHYVDRYNKDLERKIDKDFDPDYNRKMSDQEFQAKLKQRGKERDQSRINLDEEEIPDQSGIYITGQQGEYIDGPFDDLRSVRHEWDLHPEYYKKAHKEELTHEEAWERFGIVEGLGNLKNIGDLVKQSHDKIRASIQSKVGMTQDQINDAGAKKIKAKWKNIGDEIIKSRLGEAPQGVAEGWESGPDEPRTQERDPDAEYDARRQEKLDAEADSAPKTTTYQCVGRGPNDEPNYKFGPEHNTSEEAVAYRKKLMANPKTPNPRDIGIRTISKVAKGINEDVTSTDPLEGALLDAIHELIGQGHTDVDPMVLTNMVVAATSRPFLLKDLVDANNNSQAVQHYIDSISPSKVKFSSDMLTVKNEDPAKDKAKAQAGVSSMASRAANRNRLGEGTETPLQNKEDYNAKRKALQDIQLDPDTAKDPQLKAEVIRRLASLNQQYSMLREQISKFKESRGHKVIATKLGNMDRMQNVQVPSPAERQEQLRIAKEKEQAGKKQVKEFAAPGMNPATPVATNTAAKPDPATVAKAAAATNTLKAATGTVVAPATLDKALDSATQGTATSTDVKALAPIMGVVNKAASDPKLAAQFKNLANQAKTTP